MKRKRFVKLLMAKGYSRNGAAEIADDALRSATPYAISYDERTTPSGIMRRIRNAMEISFRDAISKAKVPYIYKLGHFGPVAGSEEEVHHG